VPDDPPHPPVPHQRRAATWAGEILTRHISSIDTLARPVISAGATIPASGADEVRARPAAFMTIWYPDRTDH
jgi:hypothetical protein